eukprot:gene15128-biopygen3523
MRGLQGFINGSFSSNYPLVVPSSYLSVGSVYSFRSRLCNFIGACSEVSQAVQVESGFVPSVSIAGSQNVSMTRSQSLQLISVANGRDCSGKAVSVSYEWKVLQWSSPSQSTVLEVQSTSKDPSRFVLQSYVLPGKGRYEVVVTTVTATSSNSSASVIVNVVAGKLVALVQGSSESMYLALPVNTLASGVSYTFALRTNLQNQAGAVSTSSSITITVNAPPLPGLFLVQPSSGMAYVDSFTLSCSLWRDSNLPLSYQFSYLIESSGLTSKVRGVSVVGYATTLLPAGSKTRNNSVVVIADVYDSLNANTTISNTVKVMGLAQNSLNISSFITAATSSASSVDGLIQGTSLSSMLLNQANCTLAPDCSKLNRKDCFSTPHTCGSCVSSAFVGQVGDSNNPCRAVNSTREVTSMQVQQCGGNCSSHGQCGFFSSLDGKEVSVCYQGEVTCYAKCVCDEGYGRSEICDKSDAEVEERSKLREQVIGGIEQLIEQQDPTEQNIATWMSSVLQSTLEQELQLTSTSVNLPNCGNDSSSSGVTVSILSLSSSLYNASSFLSSPISLYLSSLPCSNSSSESCSADITVATSYVNQSQVESKNSSITCVAGDTSMHFVDCGDGRSYNVSCSGKAEVIVASCPSTRSFATCNGLEASKAVDIGCKVIMSGDGNVTCSCPLVSPSAQSSSAGNHISGKETCEVSYVSMLRATTSNFKKTVLSAQGLDESTVSDSWEALVTLGTFVGAVIVAMLFSTYADREREKRVQVEEQLKHNVKKAVLSRNRLSGEVSSPQTIKELAEEALPEMLLTSESLLKRIWKEVKKHHRWVGVIYYFSKKFPRILRVMSLATNVVIMLFLQSLTYALTNGDDGSCQKYVTETACLEPSSAYSTGGSMCYWTSSDSGSGVGTGVVGSCHYVQPDSSITVVVFVAIFSGLLSSPIALSLDWIIQNILAAPLKGDHRESSIVAVAEEVSDGSAKNGVIVPTEVIRDAVPTSSSKGGQTMSELSRRDPKTMEAQRQLEEVSRMELERLCNELMVYREGIKSSVERKEFD